MDFATKYRPVRFEDVIGQDGPVRVLSGLIKRGQLGRNLLLSGALGSGKTTLVRIYAKALNCAHVNSSGSPCNKCEYCAGGADGGLHEYDVSGRGGDLEKVRNWVARFNETPTDLRFRVLFFDEAHALKADAADSLLKQVEEPKEGVIFCFATTEPSKLRRTLRSRLMQLEVRALSLTDGIALLEKVAKEEGVSYEANALALLTGVKLGYPRDLLTGLEQVADDEAGVTVEAVRKIFDIDHTDVLVDYFTALADGDRIQQAAIIAEWREDDASKLGWIKAFLTTVYYNDILGQDVIVDPLTFSIGSKRRQVIDRFCNRLCLNKIEDLERYWLEMMAFWHRPVGDIDGASFRLLIALFHNLVNRQKPGDVSGRQRSTAIDGDPPDTIQQQVTSLVPDQSVDRTDDIDRRSQNSIAQYLTAENVRDIVNSSSFFCQHYGQWFNASFEVRPSQLVNHSEDVAIRLIDNFCRDLSHHVNEKSANLNRGFASIAVRERDEEGVFALLVSHIPEFTKTASKRNEAGIALRAWCAEWCQGEHHVEAKFSFEYRGAAVRFHWNEVLRLCASFDEDGDEYAPNASSLGLRRRLGISKLRRAGPLHHPLIIFSDLLSPAPVAAACQGSMAPLSAFDAQAWDFISSGWELREHHSRRKTTESRKRKLREIERRWPADEHRRRSEIEQEIGSWPSHPERRTRDWHGWWLHGE